MGRYVEAPYHSPVFASSPSDCAPENAGPPPDHEIARASLEDFGSDADTSEYADDIDSFDDLAESIGR